MYHFLYFGSIMRLTPLDFFEVKWLNSHIFMSYMDVRTYTKFNGSMDANYQDREEENRYSTFLRGWSSNSTFLGDSSSFFTFLGG